MYTFNTGVPGTCTSKMDAYLSYCCSFCLHIIYIRYIYTCYPPFGLERNTQGKKGTSVRKQKAIAAHRPHTAARAAGEGEASGRTAKRGQGRHGAQHYDMCTALLYCCAGDKNSVHHILQQYQGLRRGGLTPALAPRMPVITKNVLQANRGRKRDSSTAKGYIKNKNAFEWRERKHWMESHSTNQQGKARPAISARRGGPHLDLVRLPLNTWSKSDFSIAWTTWATLSSEYLLRAIASFLIFQPLVLKVPCKNRCCTHLY